MGVRLVYAHKTAATCPLRANPENLRPAGVRGAVAVQQRKWNRPTPSGPGAIPIECHSARRPTCVVG